MADAPPAEHTCIFCRIGAQDESGDDTQAKLFTDDRVFIVEDISPHSTHHYLVIPHEHLPPANQLSSQHRDIVEHMHNVGVEFMKQRACGENESLATDELRGGFHYPPLVSMQHLHMHIIYPASAMSWVYRNVVFRHTRFFRSVDDVVQTL